MRRLAWLALLLAGCQNEAPEALDQKTEAIATEKLKQSVTDTRQRLAKRYNADADWGKSFDLPVIGRWGLDLEPAVRASQTRPLVIAMEVLNVTRTSTALDVRAVDEEFVFGHVPLQLAAPFALQERLSRDARSTLIIAVVRFDGVIDPTPDRAGILRGKLIDFAPY